jgi:hypothetical protein
MLVRGGDDHTQLPGLGTAAGDERLSAGRRQDLPLPRGVVRALAVGVLRPRVGSRPHHHAAAGKDGSAVRDLGKVWPSLDEDRSETVEPEDVRQLTEDEGVGRRRPFEPGEGVGLSWWGRVTADLQRAQVRVASNTRATPTARGGTCRRRRRGAASARTAPACSGALPRGQRDYDRFREVAGAATDLTGWGDPGLPRLRDVIGCG